MSQENTVASTDTYWKLETIEQWEQRFHDLNSMFHYVDGWDGEDAPPLDQKLLHSAVTYLSSLAKQEAPPPSRIIATQDGEVVFEWQLPNQYIEATIDRPYHAYFIYRARNQEMIHDEYTWKAANNTDNEPSIGMNLNYASQKYATLRAA